MSCLSSKRSSHIDLREELREEFEYIQNNDVPDFFHIFHLLMRRKYFLRMCPKLNFQIKPDDFEEVEDSTDQYAFYKENFWSLRFLHKNVDQELFTIAATRARKKGHEAVEKKYREKPGIAFELELFMEEFRLLIDLLADYYKRAQLYHFIDVSNLKQFKKIDIDQKLRSVLMPLMVSKLVGRFSTISSAVVRKLLIAILTKVVAVNVGCVELFLPDLAVFNENSRLMSYVSNFLSSRVFTREKEQLKFFLTLITARVSELLAELSLCFGNLLGVSEPLSFAEFETRIEELNYKFEEINAMNLHHSTEQLDFTALCRLVPMERKGEEAWDAESTRKFSSDQESSAEGEQTLQDFFSRQIEEPPAGQDDHEVNELH